MEGGVYHAVLDLRRLFQVAASSKEKLWPKVPGLSIVQGVADTQIELVCGLSVSSEMFVGISDKPPYFTDQ